MHEILSPAGDMKCLKAAVAAGADAVYIGGKDFSARSYAGNFSCDEIVQAVEYCHLRNVKLYVAVNTMLFNGELERASEYCVFLSNAGADAVITADMGLARILVSHVGIPVHASTQMCVHNAEGAVLLKNAGFSRAVLARELSIDEIKAVADTGIETEVFVHGALCSSVSGLCLMSSFIGGRSGNRGKCAQPCRLPYKTGHSEKYFLSTADICAADILPELTDAGVISFKIEGRMKPPEYVAGVTGVYAEAFSDLDSGRYRRGMYSEKLSRYYNRTFTQSYFFGKTDVIAEDRPDNRSVPAEATIGEERKLYFPEAEIVLEEGKRPVLNISLNGEKVSVTGEKELETAVKPLSSDSVRDSVLRTGGTPFEFTSADIRITGNPYISKADVNALRRNALQCVTDRICAEGKRPYCGYVYDAGKSGIVHSLNSVYAQSSDADILADAARHGAERLYYAPAGYSVKDLEKAEYIYSRTGVRPYLCAVPFLRDADMDELAHNLSVCADLYAGVLCGNFSQSVLKEITGCVISDFTCNTANPQSVRMMKELGFSGVTLSLEMSRRDILGLDSCLPCEMVVYGHVPLMWLAHDLVSMGFSDRKNYRYGAYEYRLNHKLLRLDNPVMLMTREISCISSCVDSVRLLLNSHDDVKYIDEYIHAVRCRSDIETRLADATQGHLKRGV